LLEQTQVPHGRAGRKLAFPPWSEHQRIGSGGARDHVRLLSGDRIEEQAIPVQTRTRSQKLVSLRIPPNRSRQLAERERRLRICVPLKRKQRGTNEELEADERGHGIAGQAEHERAIAHAERDRLS